MQKHAQRPPRTIFACQLAQHVAQPGDRRDGDAVNREAHHASEVGRAIKDGRQLGIVATCDVHALGSASDG
eukprot:364889-Chlamydomonas_euryale.AAC.3